MAQRLWGKVGLVPSLTVVRVGAAQGEEARQLALPSTPFPKFRGS